MEKNQCPFERAILSSQFACSQAEKFFIAHKEGVACGHPVAFVNCEALVAHLRGNARFALHLHDTQAALPHGQEMKIKCGGLLGLQAALHPERAEQVSDIHALVQKALQRYGDLAKLPYQRIVQSIASYRLRAAGRPGRD